MYQSRMKLDEHLRKVTIGGNLAKVRFSFFHGLEIHIKHRGIECSRKFLFPTVHGQSRCMALFPNASLLVSNSLIGYSRNSFHATIFLKLHVVASCSMFLNIDIVDCIILLQLFPLFYHILLPHSIFCVLHVCFF